FLRRQCETIRVHLPAGQSREGATTVLFAMLYSAVISFPSRCFRNSVRDSLKDRARIPVMIVDVVWLSSTVHWPAHDRDHSTINATFQSGQVAVFDVDARP